MPGKHTRGYQPPPRFNNRQWDGIWTGKALRSEIGWTLEIEIPFSTLNFDPNAEAWEINFQRTVRRKNEESLWSGWLSNQGLNRLSNAGQLVGLDDIAEARGVDVKPYLLGTSAAAPGRGSARARNDMDVGADVFSNPAPGVRTNLAVNTDFAQTEVDQRLTNLERFPQFFPEKRDFFLDGATFFDFQSTAANDNSPLPFFTRRIGITLPAGSNYHWTRYRVQATTERPLFRLYAQLGGRSVAEPLQHPDRRAASEVLDTHRF